MLGQNSWRRRFRCAGTHLLLSGAVVGVIALWMFFVWYPEPFRSLSGGLHLFAILVMVDLMLGPFATLVVSSPGKSAREWRVDMALIVLMQLAALGYGCWTVYQARPVYMAFEIDRFRTVHAIDVPAELLSLAPAEFQSLPVLGPALIAVRPFKDEKERIDATLAAMQGVHLGARPDLWTPYETEISKILADAKSIDELLTRKPIQAALIQSAILSSGVSPNEVAYLPVAGREVFWTVLIQKTSGKPLVYLPIDPY
nr:TfpX/TfpZ family type IV pilin accessory protein [Hydrogenophaga sp. PBL-H3]